MGPLLYKPYMHYIYIYIFFFYLVIYTIHNVVPPYIVKQAMSGKRSAPAINAKLRMCLAKQASCVLPPATMQRTGLKTLNPTP